MIVTCARQVLKSKLGHAEKLNDKSLILFNELVSNVNQGEIPNNFEYILCDKDIEDNIV